MDIIIKKWVSRNEIVEGMQCSIGGMGGWFEKGHTWKDYINRIPKEAIPYAIALKQEIRKINLKEGGDWHQHQEGTPVFSDGSYGSFSFRAWGDLLAAIWTDQKNNIVYCYLDFY